jgi:two-component system LytT family response regulator
VIRTIIADDEAPARQQLRELLAAEANVEVVGEYRSGALALRQLSISRPDLFFLDLGESKVTGFDVLKNLRGSGLPQPFVVFVTGDSQYAARAFEENALDYLVKPFDARRFSKTLDRMRERLIQRSSRSGRSRYFSRLAVKSGGNIHFVNIGEVDWIASEENYLRLHVGAESHLFRGTISGVEERLDPTQFVRINRSMIVNVDRIAGLKPSFQRDHIVCLRDGTRLRLLAPYRSRLDAAVVGL